MTEADRAPRDGGRAQSTPRYELVSLVATGGMGQVWRAEDTLLHREVAVKLLKAEYAGDELFRTRFEVEARTAAGLQHPHVASILDYGMREDPDGGAPRPMLVMELVQGPPLSALIGDPSLTHERAGELVAQAGEGLAAAHRKGIVHRDVKPGNLLVAPDGQVKVTDFGIARAADAVALTMTGHLMGTPHYLSPEQAEGGRATAASDVYALGVVLFECLTGSKPFEADSPVVTALRHVRDPLPPLPATVPQRLRAVVERACAKDPAARFTDGGEMAAALRGEVPVWSDSATTVLSPPPAGATAVLPLAAGAGPMAHPRHGRPRLGWWALAAVAAVLVLVPLVWGARALLGGDDPAGTAAATSNPGRSSSEAGVRVDAEDYLGLPEPEARQGLEALGLRPEVERRDPVGSEPPGTVAEVRPTGLVEPGSTVTLVVPEGPPPPQEEQGGDATGDEPDEAGEDETDETDDQRKGGKGGKDDRGKGGKGKG